MLWLACSTHSCDDLAAFVECPDFWPGSANSLAGGGLKLATCAERPLATTMCSFTAP